MSGTLAIGEAQAAILRATGLPQDLSTVGSARLRIMRVVAAVGECLSERETRTRRDFLIDSALAEIADWSSGIGAGVYLGESDVFVSNAGLRRDGARDCAGVLLVGGTVHKLAAAATGRTILVWGSSAHHAAVRTIPPSLAGAAIIRAFELLRQDGVDRGRRLPHCWNCPVHLDSEFDPRCDACGWLICPCGSCAQDCRRPKERAIATVGGSAFASLYAALKEACRDRRNGSGIAWLQSVELDAATAAETGSNRSENSWLHCVPLPEEILKRVRAVASRSQAAP